MPAGTPHGGAAEAGRQHGCEEVVLSHCQEPKQGVRLQPVNQQ